MVKLIRITLLPLTPRCLITSHINDDYSLLNDGGDDESTHLQEAVATMQQREVSTERSESTGCVICKETLADTTTWDCASCTQSYHRHCIKRSYEYCDRCPYCREMITLDVEDDEFNGKPLYFAAWKSKLVIHLAVLSEQRALEELQHKRAKPLTRFDDLLERQPELLPRPPAANKEVTWQHDWHKTLLNQQLSYIKLLQCETLPSGFKEIATTQMDEPVHVVWRLVEKQYSLINAAGTVYADFKSVGQLFKDLNNVRSQVNVNAHEAPHTHMITSKMMLVMVLGVLPRHMWGFSVEFTTEGLVHISAQIIYYAVLVAPGDAFLG
ncbi:hypothetical protein PHYSODRAFT_326563 [Phytophthora sojae]|uniref:RING-type domain-containing protein n=1 Tax=Phytophthora sojae (strain P6497) TaxID=1094619 RepID=G4YWC2_PHYSP|nr:hypothetical protein PHYSODRAFT_326563 [Phytophthora sojae]EGZ25569.1 hypothetical protein PHYSODRAFT_326563 [Phytophthora sojae]|eukprot:XP_009520857.1 hypothetical protein PHYSODRAFT_326563 [Phytophthora sojae]